MSSFAAYTFFCVCPYLSIDSILWRVVRVCSCFIKKTELHLFTWTSSELANSFAQTMQECRWLFFTAKLLRISSGLLGNFWLLVSLGLIGLKLTSGSCCVSSSCFTSFSVSCTVVVCTVVMLPCTLSRCLKEKLWSLWSYILCRVDILMQCCS